MAPKKIKFFTGKNLAAAFAAACALTAAACAGIGNEAKEEAKNSEGIIININVQENAPASAARSIMPGNSPGTLASLTPSYKITVSFALGAPETQTNVFSGGSNVFFSLRRIAPIEITVEAWSGWSGGNVAGCKLLQKTVQFTREETETGTLNITLNPLVDIAPDAVGNFYLQVSWTDVNGLTKLKAELKKEGVPVESLQIEYSTGLTTGAAPETVLSDTPKDATLRADGIPAGSYILKLTFFKGSVVMGVFFEAVTVWAQMTSSTWCNEAGECADMSLSPGDFAGLKVAYRYADGRHFFYNSISDAFYAASGTESAPDVITIIRDIEINNTEIDHIRANFTANKHIKLTVLPNTTHTLNRTEAGVNPIFWVRAASSLTLGGNGTGKLIIDGGAAQTAVQVDGIFKMSGGAFISTVNAVQLESGAKVTITGSLTGGASVASITPHTYSTYTQVLDGDPAALIAENRKKFEITPQPVGGLSQCWNIDTYGRLILPEVTTFAGNGTSADLDGTGTMAQFSSPSGITADGSGNVYVADSGSHRIRKITTGYEVTTIAGNGDGYTDAAGTAAQFSSPCGITVDGSGNLYVADTVNNRIRKITTGDVVTTIAGNGTLGFADETGTAAMFNSPNGIAVDGSGNVYVADTSNNRIRKITTGDVVTTIAGNGTPSFADAAGTAAMFNSPNGIAVDGSGNVYVVDTNNNRIRKITSAGVVSTIAGNGTAGHVDGVGTAAEFNCPIGVAVDENGNLYVADMSNQCIRKITSAGVVSTIAGNGTAGHVDAAGTAAQFNYPAGVAVDGNYLYVADTSNYRIRRITR